MYKPLIMSLTLWATLAVSPVLAFHADIFLTQQSGALITGRGANDPGTGGNPLPGIRFHVNDIVGLTPYVDVNPGFRAEEASDSFFLDGTYQPLPGNANVGFNIRAFRIQDGPAANLFFWNGSGEVDFQPAANANDSLDVRSGSLGSAVATGQAVDVPGFDFTATDPTGFIHSHLVFDFDADNNAGTPASTGIFLTAFEFNMDLTGDGTREVARPHYVAWFNGPPGTLKTDSMAATNVFLAEGFAALRLLGDVSPPGEDDLPDDLVNADDIDALLAAINSGSIDPLFDLNSDTHANADDVGVLFGVLGTQYGDANLDGQVNAADLAIWQENYGTIGGWAAGDFNGDTNINGRDFLIWQRHFGFAAASSASPLVVPEPSSMVFAAVLAFAVWNFLSPRREGAISR